MFLLQMQMKVKDRSLPEHYIEFAKQHVYESNKNSTRYYFEDNKFYQDLPTQMQRKIAKRVLYNEIRKFKYFFHDF